MQRHHACCERCHRKRFNAIRPVRVYPPKQETCCFCGHITTSGINVLTTMGAAKHCTCGAGDAEELGA